MEEIILVGGGGHCRSCIDVIEQEGKFKILGFVDLPQENGLNVLGYNQIGVDSDIAYLAKSCRNFLITAGQVGSPDLRKRLFEIVRNQGALLPVVKSPFAYISKYSTISEGSIIMHHAIINANASIGRNCIINTKALIEHDSLIEDNCHISTGAVINGGVQIGANTFVGSNAVSKENITIPENSFIKANSLVK